MDKYRHILKQYWGYDNFRNLQEEIIQSVGSGRDTLGLMPTGGGKSITFQVPALAKEGLCIVITPLIALMKDQVQNLRTKGIKAVAIYSGMTRREIIVALDNCIFGDYKFLYISPERLDTEIFRAKLAKFKVSIITVDESHCISQWGYDFRPAYLKIAEIRDMLPEVPVLALTATATSQVVEDIQQKLKFRESNVFRMSFERRNLAYIVRKTENKQNELFHILHRVPGSAIVYARSRKKTKEIAELLRQENITTEFYHAGLNNEEKDLRQKEWKTGKARVMVATNAFGMGIDKPDVRLVIHTDLPDSPEAYFQEAGRAGRDGEKAYAVLLYGKSDKITLKKRITDTFPDKDYIKQTYEHLNYYYQMAMGDGLDCTYPFNIEDFCRKFKHYPVPTHSALRILTQARYIEYTEEQENSSRLIFILRRDELYKLKQSDTDTEHVILTVLRMYTGLFSEYAYINESSIAARTALTHQQVYDILISLSKRRIIDYIPYKRTPFITYTRERVELRYLNLPQAVYQERKERYAKRIEAMIEYAESIHCRSRILLRYFGEKNEHNCGQCDVCSEKRKKNTDSESMESIQKQILTMLETKPLPPNELAVRIDAPSSLIADTLRFMLDEKILSITDGMIGRLNQ